MPRRWTSGHEPLTLSACETGVGEVRNGGRDLRSPPRAGARRCGDADDEPWKVDDRATEQLMTRTYGKLLRGGGRSDALREVQLEMMATPATAHPFYWASFIVSGDQRTLDGKPAPAVRAPGEPIGGPWSGARAGADARSPSAMEGRRSPARCWAPPRSPWGRRVEVDDDGR